MPTHSTDLSDPSQWGNPPVPESWWQTIRETMPAYAPDLTPTRSMGKIAETFRKQDGVLRSAHPLHSFCARGPQASYIIGNHSLAYGMGENSPLGRIYDLQGSVLLLGVGHSSNTSIHLAEYRADFPSKRVVTGGCPEFLRQGQGYGAPLKISMWTIRISITSVRIFCVLTRESWYSAWQSRHRKLPTHAATCCCGLLLSIGLGKIECRRAPMIAVLEMVLDSLLKIDFSLCMCYTIGE